MNEPAAIQYAQRVLSGQSPDVPPVERMRRVKRALDGQGLKLTEPEAFYGTAKFDAWVLQLSLSAFNAGGTLQERVARVAKVADGIGASLPFVLSATKRYMKLKTRRARRERLHS